MNFKSNLKTRFCPSPTGLMHLGNARTALFNALLAKGQHGVFLLRIEDTDQTRSEEIYTDALQADLRWLGLDWDEGPGCKGTAGPYWQSQRQAIYDQFYQQLEQQDLAYPCFCSEQQLAIARKVQRVAGKPPRYPGTCRSLTAQQIDAQLAKGLQPTLRFRIPTDEQVVFHDWVRGEQCFHTNDIGDFIIRRADGTPPFMYCNAIDDALMGVTHALRGEDHLANTPRQLLILQALDLPIPQYGHISLILGQDGAPLSKRNGSQNLQELRTQGYLPQALVNYLARLGHYYAEHKFMSLAELAEQFSLSSLGSAPARFDPQQLLYWQQEAVVQLDTESFWQWVGENIRKAVPTEFHELFAQSVRPNIVFPAAADHWLNVFFSPLVAYGEVQQAIIKEAGAKFFTVVDDALVEAGADLAVVTASLKTRLNIKGKGLFQPLRVALTGELHGPELIHVFELLGIKQMRERIQQAACLCDPSTSVGTY